MVCIGSSLQIWLSIKNGKSRHFQNFTKLLGKLRMTERFKERCAFIKIQGMSCFGSSFQVWLSIKNGKSRHFQIWILLREKSSLGQQFKKKEYNILFLIQWNYSPEGFLGKPHEYEKTQLKKKGKNWKIVKIIKQDLQDNLISNRQI